MSRISVLAYLGDSAEQSPHQTPAIQWAISIEPTKHHHFNTSANKPTIFNSQNSPSEIDVEPVLKGIIGKTSRSVSESDIRQILTQHKPSTSSESWLEAGLQSLQETGIIPKFSIISFRVHAVEAIKKHNLENGSGTLTIDYGALMKQSEDTKDLLGSWHQGEPYMQAAGKSYLGFRVSRPVPRVSPKRRVMSFERQDDPYGGLM